ncbi:hypothetical protein TPHA_0E02000 [Tetrapisispora phaffii CBS 4417]|uniref:Mak10 subunit, NatC N(Alpha)-terminal acetyltransferase n=1 Tax=Tetrapisispora phaffii (strain ATCC 24235 / CBS 4417 / NBRC 1672 / NRRL Y-8282 / UCD 70-5) TaxID=1071381 RepID=G8BTR4_TETPH|nr:hypothetical protein TPHA_0E02000 [Tetrapisispora phaffii CBS 4417]CCE63292.1 hypothetical protein TPHA_0E02000 [Tetrapisispora phaffii CBS 4417]
MFKNYPNNDELIDVTDIFKNLGKNLKEPTIIKASYFDLFEGTRSLEVENARLDSTLIHLTEIEKNFNCNAIIGDENDLEVQLDNIISISDRLLRNVISWLNNYQTLPTTILSCTYVEHILLASEKSHKIEPLSTGNELYDKTLSGLCIGICYFGKFVLHLMKSGVLMEEEDLNFNFMGLDFLTFQESSKEVLELLEESLTYLDTLENGKKQYLKDFIRITICLVHIEETCTTYSTDLKFLNELAELGEKYNSIEVLTSDVPEGSFSMGIQKRMSNQYPPRKLVNVTNNYSGYKDMAMDIKRVLLIHEEKSALEMLQFSYYFGNLQQRHVLARGIFSLFFMRDNLTILGKYKMPDFVIMQLNEFSLTGCTSSIENLTPEQKLFLEPVLEEATKVLLEFYQNFTQNNCRIRQGYNRQLLLWDSLQAQFENAETLLEQNGVINVVSNEPVVTYFPYSLWAYFQKVTLMIDFVLKGFDLEIYQPYETFAMYYFVYYLTYKREYALRSVQQFIEKKIHSIQAMNKKIKKLKTVEKKEALKVQYKKLMETVMPSLQRNKQYLNFLTLRNTITKSLSLCQFVQFGVLKSYGIIDNHSSSISEFIDHELIHKLRFKSFSSIGVPELPTYEIFESTLKEFTLSEPNLDSKVSNTIGFVNKECTKTIESLDSILQAIKAGDNNGTMLTGSRLIKEDALKHYEQLKYSCQDIQKNIVTLTKKINVISERPLSEHFKVILKFSDNGSSFFPLLSLEDKTKID